jgi:hypothetical protein
MLAGALGRGMCVQIAIGGRLSCGTARGAAAVGHARWSERARQDRAGTVQRGAQGVE